MSGHDKAEELANKLKEEKEEKQLELSERKQGVLNSLAALHDNSELAQMYKDNAQVGAENLGGELPLLKIHAAGRSSNELADGSRPTDGWFFYKPTQEQFKTLHCHILTISRGFKAPGLEQNGETKDKFNQLLGGVIIDGLEYKPFIMYFTGKKLSKLWEFGKAANKYTHAKPVPIPMFALTVTLTTVTEKNDFGESWVAEFEIEKNENGSPILVLDPGKFQFLKDSVEMVEETISNLIALKTSKEVRGEAGVVADDMPFS